MVPNPAPERKPWLGETVHYVMPDGVTIRPAMIVAFYDSKGILEANLQVFVDGKNDSQARGPHANATLQDWRTDVPYDVGLVDRDYPELAPIYPYNTWHFRPEKEKYADQ
jgi:hypothetical protein